MPCPVCGRVYCDHSPAERGQTHEEMMEELDRDFEKAKKEEKERGKTSDQDTEP